MAVAAAFTALIARRLATVAGSPYPAATGLAAGVLFALLPAVIRYAQEARSYAIVTMLAAITTYLLLRAIEDGGRWVDRVWGGGRADRAVEHLRAAHPHRSGGDAAHRGAGSARRGEAPGPLPCLPAACWPGSSR